MLAAALLAAALAGLAGAELSPESARIVQDMQLLTNIATVVPSWSRRVSEDDDEDDDEVCPRFTGLDCKKERGGIEKIQQFILPSVGLQGSLPESLLLEDELDLIDLRENSLFGPGPVFPRNVDVLLGCNSLDYTPGPGFGGETSPDDRCPVCPEGTTPFEWGQCFDPDTAFSLGLIAEDPSAGTGSGAGAGVGDSDLTERELAAVLTVSILFLITAVTYLALRRRSPPDADLTHVVTALFGMADFGSDLVFFVYLAGGDFDRALVLACAVSIALTGILNLVAVMSFLIRHLQKNRTDFYPWLSRNIYLASLITFLSFSQVETMNLLGSRLLGREMFSAPWSAEIEHRLGVLSFITVVVEDIPQLIIASIVLEENREVSMLAIASITITTISLFYGLLRRVFMLLLVMFKPGAAGIEPKSSTAKRMSAAMSGRLSLRTQPPPMDKRGEYRPPGAVGAP